MMGDEVPSEARASAKRISGAVVLTSGTCSVSIACAVCANRVE